MLWGRKSRKYRRPMAPVPWKKRSNSETNRQPTSTSSTSPKEDSPSNSSAAARNRPHHDVGRPGFAVRGPAVRYRRKPGDPHPAWSCRRSRRAVYRRFRQRRRRRCGRSATGGAEPVSGGVGAGDASGAADRNKRRRSRPGAGCCAGRRRPRPSSPPPGTPAVASHARFTSPATRSPPASSNRSPPRFGAFDKRCAVSGRGYTRVRNDGERRTRARVIDRRDCRVLRS